MSDQSPAFLTEERKYLRTLAQLAGLDPRLGVRVDESDLVQETLVRASRYGAALHDFSPEQRRSLLREIFNNRLTDLIRYHHAECRDIDCEQAARAQVENSTVAWEQNVADSGFSPSELLEREERFARVAVAVQSLPEKERLVIQSKFFLDLSLSQVADRIGMNKERVAGYYRRGLQRLKIQLGDLESQL